MNIIPHVDLAAFCSAVYYDAKSWDHYAETEGVVVGHKRLNGSVDVLAFRGSLVVEDWMRDLDEMPVDHPLLGHVHKGFLAGMDATFEAVQPWLGSWVVLTGHSLGAARAWVMAGLMAARKRPPNQVTVFGSPRPGFAKLAGMIQSSGSVITSYRNRLDPVTEVPFLLGLYEHPAPLVQLHGMPGKMDLTPFRDHHCNLYIDGLAELAQAA